MRANLAKSKEFNRISGHSPELQYYTLIYIVIPVNDLNYNVNDAGTAIIHVVIPVIDRNYDIYDIMTANLAKSRELIRISGHSPELRYYTLIYIIVIPVNDLNYDVNDARTAIIHVVIPVIDRNYDIHDNRDSKSREITGCIKHMT